MKKQDLNYDFAGIILSAICGIHCLITPFAILYFPKLGENLESIWVHTLLIIFTTYAFHQSVYSHYKHHRSRVALGTGILGLSFFLGTYIIEVFFHSHEDAHAHGPFDEPLILSLAIGGALLLITSHVINMRKCRCLSK